MTIGKRKGIAAKGAYNPAQPGDKVGGSLSKNDHWYIQQAFGMGGDPGAAGPSTGHEATGGIVSDFVDPTGQLYRSHIFLQSGTFEVTAKGGLTAGVEVLAVGGGGAGGLQSPNGYGAGGGGGGGVVTNMLGHPRTNSTNAPVAASTSYAVTVGAGGAPPSGTDKTAQPFSNGTPSNSPVWPIVAAGGGAGANNNGDIDNAQNQGLDGGSGGAGQPTKEGAGNSPPLTPVQGYPGGHFNPGGQYYGGGGGGAGEAGFPGVSSGPGGPTKYAFGGNGIQVAFAGPPTNSPIGTPGNTPNGTSPTDTGYFGGGGGGATMYGGPNAPNRLGGSGGGAMGDIESGSPTWVSGQPGTREGQTNTGGGGGGKCKGTSYPHGEMGKSSGGSGIYVIRYKIDSSQSKTAVCSGGSICFSPTKTIHAFTESGTFTAPGSFSETCEYIVIGGGGGGGDTRAWSSHAGAGGGAGAVIPGSTPLSGPFTKAITIGQGGTKGTQDNWGAPGGETVFTGVVTAKGGGGGAGSGNGTADPSHMNGRPSANPGGGSGGGSTYTGTPGNGGTYGNNGGDASPPGGGAGGGGAGGAGGANPGNPGINDPNKRIGGKGGLGVQLPATFRTNVPSVFGVPGPGGTAGWVGGGGGGGNGHTGGTAEVMTGGGGGGAPPGPGTPNVIDPWSGGGNGDTVGPTGVPIRSPLVNGQSGTGGGGGGGMGTDVPSGDYPWAESFNGSGGSGLVLIAYPT